MNDIDKAYDEYKASEDRTIDKDSLYGRHLSERNTFNAGTEYGYKQARIETLDEIKSKLTNDKLSWTINTLEYIDTELEKLRSE